MKKRWAAVLFWGGMWGISEATVATLIHLFLPGLGWALYYPLAFGFMYGVYRQTGKAPDILYAAILSAAIKLVNIPMVPRLDYVVNPAVSILLEGLTAFWAFPLVKLEAKEKHPWPQYAALVLFAGALWRMLYLTYLSLAPGWIRDASILTDAAKLQQFAGLELLGGTAVILLGSLAVSLLMRLWARRKRAAGASILSGKAFGPVSLAVAGLSIFLNWVL
jgi:hypothetical protein